MEGIRRAAQMRALASELVTAGRRAQVSEAFPASNRQFRVTWRFSTLLECGSNSNVSSTAFARPMSFRILVAIHKHETKWTVCTSDC